MRGGRSARRAYKERESYDGDGDKASHILWITDRLKLGGILGDESELVYRRSS